MGEGVGVRRGAAGGVGAGRKSGERMQGEGNVSDSDEELMPIRPFMKNAFVTHAPRRRAACACTTIRLPFIIAALGMHPWRMVGLGMYCRCDEGLAGKGGCVLAPKCNSAVRGALMSWRAWRSIIGPPSTLF